MPLSPDPLMARNAEVRAFAEAHRLATRVHPDGEVVIRLARKPYGYAGAWSQTRWYFYRQYPGRLKTTLQRQILGKSLKTWEDHGSDIEVQSVAEAAQVQETLLRGPTTWKAKRRPAATPGNPAALSRWRASRGARTAPDAPGGF